MNDPFMLLTLCFISGGMLVVIGLPIVWTVRYLRSTAFARRPRSGATLMSDKEYARKWQRYEWQRTKNH
jgi:hypothetical protein